MISSILTRNESSCKAQVSLANDAIMFLVSVKDNVPILLRQVYAYLYVDRFHIVS